MLSFVLNHFKDVLIGILSIAVCVLIGILYHRTPATTVAQSTVQTVEKIINKDGTVTTRVVTSSSSIPAITPLAKYRVGVTANPMNIQHDQRVSVGARLGELPLFLDVGYRPLDKSVDVGISLDF